MSSFKPFPQITLLALFVISISSCSHKNDNIEPSQDEVVYISEEFLTDDNTSQPVINSLPIADNPKPKQKKQVINVKAQNVAYYKNYQRKSDAPEEYAKATLWPVIQMVYSEEFNSPQIKVLNVSQDGENLMLDLQISWRDRWTPKPYVIKGKLAVNSNHNNGNFVITSKNLEAEALELTHPNTKTKIKLSTI